MAVFDRNSRYVLHASVVTATSRDGRAVSALTPAAPAAETERGRHRKKDHERLDHLANYYLRDPFGCWRIAEINGALLPDALAERDMLSIPKRGTR